ncbi:MAG: hypothetical protein SNJ77_00145 [Cytophagales bacterium]
MGSIRDRLEKILPEFLPTEPEDAILAHHLLEKIIGLLPDVSENSIKQSFSIMASDPRSCLAKRPGRHGYFKRPENFIGSLGNHRLPKIKKSELKRLPKLSSDHDLMDDLERLERNGELLTLGGTVAQNKVLKKINTLAAGRFHPALQKRRRD